MKFDVSFTVDREGFKQILEVLPERALMSLTVKPSTTHSPRDYPSETVMSAVLRRPKKVVKRRSKVQEAIIEMLADGPLTTAEIRAGMDRFNLSPASTSALTPMRAEGRIVDAGEGKWALAAA